MSAQQDLAEELAAWLGPVLAEVGLVASSDDERVEELAHLLAAEAKYHALTHGPHCRCACYRRGFEDA
jgi:ubiquinone biosynthesis protein UbiJ